MSSNDSKNLRAFRPVWPALIATVGLVTATGYFYLQAPAEAAAPAAAATPPAMPVTVAAAIERRITEWDEFSGRLEAIERVDVRSRVSGYIESVHFAPGSVVAKGATLFVIDPKPFAAEVARAEATMAAAQARLALTNTELARAQRLLDDHAISQREFEERQNAQRDAQASIQAAQASLDIARLNLGYTRITAPIAGRVSRAEVTVGNLVAAGAGGAALTSIVSTSPIYATFEADEQTFLKYAAQAAPARASQQGRGADSPGPGQRGRASARRPDRVRRQRARPAVRHDPRARRVRQPRRPARAGPVRAAQGRRRRRTRRGPDRRPRGRHRPVEEVRLRRRRRASRWPTARSSSARWSTACASCARALRAGESIVVNGVQRVRPGVPVAGTEVPMDPRARSAPRRWRRRRPPPSPDPDNRRPSCALPASSSTGRSSPAVLSILIFLAGALSRCWKLPISRVPRGRAADGGGARRLPRRQPEGDRRDRGARRSRKRSTASRTCSTWARQATTDGVADADRDLQARHRPRPGAAAGAEPRRAGRCRACPRRCAASASPPSRASPDLTMVVHLISPDERYDMTVPAQLRGAQRQGPAGAHRRRRPGADLRRRRLRDARLARSARRWPRAASRPATWCARSASRTCRPPAGVVGAAPAAPGIDHAAVDQRQGPADDRGGVRRHRRQDRRRRRSDAAARRRPHRARRQPTTRCARCSTTSRRWRSASSRRPARTRSRSPTRCARRWPS